MAYAGERPGASRGDARDDHFVEPTSGTGTDADSEAPVGAVVGWFRDPTKHHEHRFRDGQGWTRWVSNFGVRGDDPYWAPPAWYRDPSRRFRYRYWDGDGWTPQASLGGAATRDRIDAVWPPPLPHAGREAVDGLEERPTRWSRRLERYQTAAPPTARARSAWAAGGRTGRRASRVVVAVQVFAYFDQVSCTTAGPKSSLLT